MLIKSGGQNLTITLRRGNGKVPDLIKDSPHKRQPKTYFKLVTNQKIFKLGCVTWRKFRQIIPNQNSKMPEKIYRKTNLFDKRFAVLAHSKPFYPLELL